MPNDEEIFRIVPTRRLVSSGLSVLGVLLIAGAATAYAGEDVPHYIPLLLSIAAFVCIAWSLVLGAIERMRYTRPTNESDRPDE
jgi:hypothetical protein